FCYDGEAKLFAQPDRRADDGSVAGIREQVPHERPVDLENIERKFLEVAETGIAGAEIIEHDAAAKPLNPPEGVEQPLIVWQKYVLGDLKLEERRRETGDIKHIRHRLGEIA